MESNDFHFVYPWSIEPSWRTQSGDPVGLLAMAAKFEVPAEESESNDHHMGAPQEELTSLFLERVYQLVQTGNSTPRDDHEWNATRYGWAFERESQALSEARYPLTLRNYQKHSLNRMLFIFYVLGHGALLALDMGLGKTLVVIALCVEVSNRYRTVDRRWIHQPNEAPSAGTARVLVTPFRGSILIVVPLSVLTHWERQFADHVKEGYFSVLIYYGDQGKSSKSIDDVRRYDIVITTYHTLKAEYNEREKASALGLQCECPLMSLYWLLFVLDEGHIAANPSTETSRSVQAVTAKHRVMMTGTPLMNDYTDIQSVMAFLRIKPWSDVNTFKSYFFKKTARKPGVEGGAHRLSNFMSALLRLSIRSFAIRIKKDDLFEGNTIIDIPGKRHTRVDHELTFPGETGPQKLCTRQWNPKIRQKWLLDRKKRGYQSNPEDRKVLKYIQRARIAIPHPYLLTARYGAVANRDEISAVQITELRKKREALKKRLKGKWASSRLRIVVNLLLQLLDAEPTVGILIFAETLCALDALEVALDHFNIKCDRFDGTLSKEERAKVVDTFNQGTQNNIMLITSRSGSFGIDLTRASRVIILQDGWNPAIYEQAIDRAHRFKQTKLVHVYTLRAPFSMDHKTSSAMHLKRNKAEDLFDLGPAWAEEMRKLATYDKSDLMNRLEMGREQAKRSHKGQTALLSRKSEATSIQDNMDEFDSGSAYWKLKKHSLGTVGFNVEGESAIDAPGHGAIVDHDLWRAWRDTKYNAFAPDDDEMLGDDADAVEVEFEDEDDYLGTDEEEDDEGQV